jgi:hypothetical protein
MITGQMLAVDGGLLTGFGEDLRAVVPEKNGGFESGRQALISGGVYL